MAQKTDVELLAEKETIKNETSANANTATRIGTMLENIIDSKSNNSLLSTREFNRAFSAELLFDKNEIAYVNHTLTTDVEFTVAGSGHLTNQFASSIQRIVTDGTKSVTFTGFQHVIGNIQNGSIPEAGTYLVTFLYYNGVAIANWTEPSSEVANLQALAAPANFAASATIGTEIDLSWDNVTNNSGYRIYFSLTGGTGGWTALITLPANTVTYTHSGLVAGDQRFYRILALGDQVTYNDSPFSYADATTPTTGDITAPTFTFLPANGNNTWSINQPLTITANEELRNTNGTEITNANVAALITLKQTNSGGANIAFTATIDVSKKIITITPITTYGVTQLVYLAINNVEDVNGNEVTVAQSITFTTTDYTYYNGTSSRITFGDILDSLFGVPNTNFKLEITIKNYSLSGSRGLIMKYGAVDAQKTILFYQFNDSIRFGYILSPFGARFIDWAGALDGAEHTLELSYDGSIDTNNGLDRVTLEVDNVVAGSKTLIGAALTLTDTINSSDSHLASGVNVDASGTPIATNWFVGEAKDLIIRSAGGTVVELNIAEIALGTDSSGNGRNGTWVS